MMSLTDLLILTDSFDNVLGNSLSHSGSLLWVQEVKEQSFTGGGAQMEQGRQVRRVF